jgi:hypothetical protein
LKDETVNTKKLSDVIEDMVNKHKEYCCHADFNEFVVPEANRHVGDN